MVLTGLSDLVAQAYEAACDPPRMASFVRDARAYFGAERGALAIWPHAQPDYLLPIAEGTEPGEITELFTALDDAGSLFGRLVGLEPGNGFIATHRQVPAGWPPGHVMAGLVESDEHNAVALLLGRHEQRDPFSAADLDSLQTLLRYLRRAIAVNAGFTRLFARHRAAELLLDGAPRGIVFIGQRRQPVYMNHEARRILEAGDGLEAGQPGLCLADPRAQAELDGFLAAAATGEQCAPLALRLDRPSARPAYQLVVYQMRSTPRQAALNPVQAIAAALLHDPDAPEALPDELLKTFFHLTPAEAHLTQALYDGGSVRDAANTLGISFNTARTHLRSIFAKVGVNSQAALIQQLSHSLRVLGHTDPTGG